MVCTVELRILSLTEGLKSFKVGADMTLAGRSFQRQFLIERFHDGTIYLAGIVDDVFLLLYPWLTGFQQIIDDPCYHYGFLLISPCLKSLPTKLFQH